MPEFTVDLFFGVAYGFHHLGLFFLLHEIGPSTTTPWIIRGVAEKYFGSSKVLGPA